MGKRKRLNRLITKWIKSDLPEDRSTVLLLAVTRIPTSPTPVRRPCSLPLTSSTTATTTAATDAPTTIIKRLSSASSSSPDPETIRNHLSSAARKPSSTSSLSSRTSRRDAKLLALSLKETSNGTCGSSSNNQETSTSSVATNTSPIDHSSAADTVKPSSTISTPLARETINKRTPLLMDQSVDSIGTCSLDIDASFDLPEWSEGSSLRTLRSESIPESDATVQETATRRETPQQQQKLPSYLSLACTVNGYSTTINYDPERLARSRDASPHRLHDHDTQPIAAYTIHNNLLSPPNLVPLPTAKTFLSHNKQQQHTDTVMADQTITTHHHQEFYTSTKTISSYMSKESRSNFSSSLFNADTTTTTVDACLDNNNRKNLLHVNSTGTNNKLFESKTFSNERQCVKVEDKSFIEQRIERLYGPGALAHGFLVMKKHHHQQQQQHNRSFVVDKAERHVDNHSKSMLENMIENDTSTENDDDQMKQSNSFPSLPVLRHLRPEFRAQLPIIGSKKSAEVLTKSHTVPIMKEEAKTNGHSSETNDVKQLNGNETEVACEKIELETEKDGHRFIRILENEAKRLLALADVAEKELEDPHLPEEAKGFLRSASGKAKLLVSQKMQQFKGLCTKNITQVDGEAFPTTGEDLQGFWDMVMLQVDQIDALFKELKVLKANNWQEKAEDEVDKPKISRNGATNNRTKKVLKSKPSAEAEEARKQRELQRKQMIETRRKAMREQKQNEAASQQQNIEIFVPETSS